MQIILRRFYLLGIVSSLFIHATAQPSRQNISFSASEVNNQPLQQPYVLTNKSNLCMTVYLDRPLTSYLHDLAPALANDTLSKIGNYQFSFFVDNKLIYRSELFPGAPRAAQQQQDTV